MRAVTLPETPVPKVVREEVAAHRFAGVPRRAIRLRTARGRMTLWVSPHRGGGWCQGLQKPNTRIWVTCAWWKPESGAFGPGFAGPKVFLGRAAATPGRRLQLRFRNGKSLPIPTKNGFYLYRVPDQTLVRAPPHALLLSQGPKEIAREPLFELYDGQSLLTPGRRPAGAIVGRRRPVVVQRTSQGRPRSSLHRRSSNGRIVGGCKWAGARTAVGACAMRSRRRRSGACHRSG